MLFLAIVMRVSSSFHFERKMLMAAMRNMNPNAKRTISAIQNRSRSRFPSTMKPPPKLRSMKRDRRRDSTETLLSWESGSAILPPAVDFATGGGQETRGEKSDDFF